MLWRVQHCTYQRRFDSSHCTLLRNWDDSYCFDSNSSSQMMIIVAAFVVVVVCHTENRYFFHCCTAGAVADMPLDLVDTILDIAAVSVDMIAAFADMHLSNTDAVVDTCTDWSPYSVVVAMFVVTVVTVADDLVCNYCIVVVAGIAVVADEMMDLPCLQYYCTPDRHSTWSIDVDLKIARPLSVLE